MDSWWGWAQKEAGGGVPTHPTQGTCGFQICGGHMIIHSMTGLPGDYLGKGPSPTSKGKFTAMIKVVSTREQDGL